MKRQALVVISHLPKDINQLLKSLLNERRKQSMKIARMLEGN